MNYAPPHLWMIYFFKWLEQICISEATQAVRLMFNCGGTIRAKIITFSDG